MSMVSQFEDLCKYTKVLTSGCEEEFKTFVESQLNIIKNWKEAKKEVITLQRKISKLESEKKHMDVQMKHIRRLFEQEMMKRKTLEQEKTSMERQIVLIKEVLLADASMDNKTKEKLVLLSTCKQNADPCPCFDNEDSIGSLSASDIDSTSDDLDIGPPVSKSLHKQRSQRKKMSSETVLMDKKMPREKDLLDEDVFSSELCLDQSKIEEFCDINEPISNSFDVHSSTHFVKSSDFRQFKRYTPDFRGNNTINLGGSLTVGRYSTSDKLSRSHVFCTKTIIRSEKCYHCGQIIKFCKQALKCQDCRVTCHPECKDLCTVPCIPASCTPVKGCMGTVADYTSSTSPMIPSLIVHCVNEIEFRGLKEVGLYRIPGSEREVKDLKEKFLRGRTVPCLNQVDIYTLCGTIKEFLRSLKEPLIPRASWQDFVDAAENSDAALSLKVLNEYIHNLPQPNRDTLAFFVLHLQRVSGVPECKMPTENLAKVLALTVVGHSVSEPQDINILKETMHQYKVMQKLLSINTDFWQNLLKIEKDSVGTSAVSPDCIPVEPFCRLGPFYSTLKPEAKINQQGRTPLIPRNSRLGSMRPRKKPFFSSPIIK